MNGTLVEKKAVVAEVRPDLRTAAGLDRPRRRPKPATPAPEWLLGTVLAVFTLASLETAWAGQASARAAGLAAIALTALLMGILLLKNASILTMAWRAAALFAVPAVIGLVQLTATGSEDMAATETRILRCLAVALFCLGAGAVRDGAGRDRLMDALTVLGGVLAMLGLAQDYIPPLAAWWPFPNRNHFAACCELLLPVAGWRALQRKQWRTGAAIAIALCGMLSGSRAGLGLLTAEVVLLGWWAARAASAGPNRVRQGRWVLAGALTIPVLALALGGEAMWHRLRESQPLLYRDQIWASSWQLVTERPWQGHGLGSFKTVYPAVARFDTGEVVHRAHNDWLEWMVEGGALAALPMLILLLTILRRVARIPWSLGVVAVLTHSLVDYPLDRFPLLLLFGLIATLALLEADRDGKAQLHRRTHKRLDEKPFPESERNSLPRDTVKSEG